MSGDYPLISDEKQPWDGESPISIEQWQSAAWKAAETSAELRKEIGELRRQLKASEARNREWVYLTDEDSYPPLDMEVNVWLDYARRDVATMRYCGRDERNNPIWNWHNSDDQTMLTPKAWQHLPEPPAKKAAE